MKHEMLQGANTVASITFDDGVTSSSKSNLFDNDLASVWQSERQGTGNLGIIVDFVQAINFNSLVIQVPSDNEHSFDDICLFVDQVEIMCSENTYVSDGDFIIFEAPETLVASKIELKWGLNQQSAAVAEFSINYGKNNLSKTYYSL